MVTAMVSSHCNRDWEHQYGISIENLDNPGWYLPVDLLGTELRWREFKELAINRTKEDWVRRKIAGTRGSPKFEALGGALEKRLLGPIGNGLGVGLVKLAFAQCRGPDPDVATRPVAVGVDFVL